MLQIKYFLSFYRYESSGYEDGSFRKGYTSSPFNTSRPIFQQQQQNFATEQQERSTIESGPSFHESMERFRSATGSGSGTESDGGRSTFKQKYSISSSVTQNASAVHRTAVTRSVEEQRTMITRNSQKSYHIE